jgi:NAD+ diphosphatase
MTSVPTTPGQPVTRPEEARWFAIGRRGLLARRDGAGRWALPLEGELVGLGISCDERHQVDAAPAPPAFAVALSDAFELPAGWDLLNLRALVDAFDEPTFALAGRASHTLDWATTSRFCGRCGERTVPVTTERCMRCPRCALMLYPRIAPAVIVLVRRGREALLARNARFPVPFYSTLAGFSSIGETLEETLRREVLEEVGVQVGAPRYFGSQPWPFPNSLMVAYTAEWEAGEIAIDNDEIADAGWFAPDALPRIPPHVSIARRLIDAWVLETTGRVQGQAPA